jgi:hypothetical protein
VVQAHEEIFLRNLSNICPIAIAGVTSALRDPLNTSIISIYIII